MRSTLYSQISNGTQTILPLRRQDVVLDNSCEILHHRRRLVCAVRNYHSPEPKLYSQTPKCRRPCIHAHTRSGRANTHENTSEHITHIHARARAHTHTCAGTWVELQLYIWNWMECFILHVGEMLMMLMTMAICKWHIRAHKWPTYITFRIQWTVFQFSPMR